MKDQYIKYIFTPKFTSIDKGVMRTLICDYPSLLKLGVMGEVTNKLGYNQIRNPCKNKDEEEISIEELYSHLEDMDEAVRRFERHYTQMGMEYLINVSNENKKRDMKKLKRKKRRNLLDIIFKR